MSARRACAVMSQSRTGLYYMPKRPQTDAALLHRIREIAAARVRYGARRIWVVLGFYPVFTDGWVKRVNA